MTSFFQAQNIATKITKGTIEMINPCVFKKDTLWNSSQVALLAKLNIQPVLRSLEVSQVYEKGSIYPADVLNYSDDMIAEIFSNAASRLTALSIGLNITNASTYAFDLKLAFKNVLQLSLGMG